jgi:hypothetical protein
MKYLIPVAAVLSLSACVSQEAQLERGVGFQDYTLYQQQQAYLARARTQAPPPAMAPYQTAAAPMAAIAPAPVYAAAPPPPMGAPSAQGGSIGAETLAALGAPARTTAAPAPGGEVQPLRQVEVAELPLTAIGTQTLSSGSADSYAPAAAAPAPAMIPAPAQASGNNVVAFALATTHPVGQKVYRRANPLGNAMVTRACGRYASPGMAQEAFLTRGGPERDPLGLDPDGDGYACGWDPAPFRMVRG